MRSLPIVIHATVRADALLEAGDLDGRRVWFWVIGAIKVLAEADSPMVRVVH